MNRVIRVFEKNKDSMVSEFQLSDLDLDKLRFAFSMDQNNPMYDSYKIEEETNFSDLFKTEINFDFTNFDYFLEFN